MEEYTHSIRRKLLLIIMVVSSASLLLMGTATLVIARVAFIRTLSRHMQALTNVIGTNSAAALSLNDRRAAEEVLQSLHSQPGIEQACIYSADGSLFVSYVHQGFSYTPPANALQAKNSSGSHLYNFQDIPLEGKSVGYVFIQYDPAGMDAALKRALIAISIVLILALLLSYFLANRLQAVISGPILAMANLVRRISVRKDYGIRADVASDDEVGYLAKGLNQMLDVLSERDAQLASHRDRLEEEVRRRTADLVQANAALEVSHQASEASNRAKGDFLANMSHEIRTPINGIMGMTDLVLGTELTREQREFLLLARSSADSLMSVVNDILDFSTIEVGRMTLKPVLVDLAQCLYETVQSMSFRAHQKGLEIALRIAPDVNPSVIVDLHRLRQVLVNLIGNAIKFTSAGEVFVDVRCEWEHEGRTCLHFAVSDTGEGIHPDKLKTVFDAFEQADTSSTREHGGAGLGLSISSRLVRMMGGKLWVESTPGKGSRFLFDVVLDVADVVSPPKSVSGSPLPARLEVLAMVDGNANRLALDGALSPQGVSVTMIGNDPAALQVLADACRKNPPFRIVLIDCPANGASPFAFVGELRKCGLLDTAGVIVLLPTGKIEDAARWASLGVSRCLIKPVRPSDLLDALLAAAGDHEANRTAGLNASPRSPSAPVLQILLVEDNEVNQQVAVHLLEQWHHQVTIAANGRVALDRMRQCNFDLILMDLQMPEMDGYETVGIIRELERDTGQHIPVIALTAHAMSQDRARCLAAGMDNYLTKPLRRKELEEMLAKYAKTPKEDTPATTGPPPADSAEPRSVLDWDNALEMAGRDEGFLFQLVDVFLTTSAELMDNLTVAVRERDTGQIILHAHTLKGSAQIFGAQATAESARRVEKAGKAGVMDGIDRLFDVLRSDLNTLVQELKTAAERHKLGGMEIGSDNNRG